MACQPKGRTMSLEYTTQRHQRRYIHVVLLYWGGGELTCVLVLCVMQTKLEGLLTPLFVPSFLYRISFRVTPLPHPASSWYALEGGLNLRIRQAVNRTILSSTQPMARDTKTTKVAASLNRHRKKIPSQYIRGILVGLCVRQPSSKLGCYHFLFYM